LIRINIDSARPLQDDASQGRAVMIGITLSTDQIRNAPKEVRQWIEHEVIASLGLAAEAPIAQPIQAARLSAVSEEEAAAILAQVRGMLPAVNVFFEFGRPGIAFGEPPVMAFRLIDILHHTKLQNMGQVMACLEAINDAFARLRGDAAVRFCGFDNEGHCFVAPETQVSIAALWHHVIASQQAVRGAPPVEELAPAA
jgi:hypothetical protein